ncbi:MAG: radical SAM family heme chaperone HemW [Rhodothermales bacterium]|nr:radical SAM family heme chaperone HemW [Rhodothermales bacterium]
MAGIYVHVPFCSQRCVYCDFYFVTTTKSYGPYLKALELEMRHVALHYSSLEPIDTIYIGGGTPSVLSASELSGVIATIHELFDTSSVTEVTLELNPEDFDEQYLRDLRSVGVNRLSIGVQSFFQSDLEFMNRSHNSEDAHAVVEGVRRAGFDNFSIDLIFGLPNQPEEYWAANLEKTIRLGIPHVSTYSLTIEEKTVLHKQVQLGNVTPELDEVVADRFRFTMSFLRDAGYEHYEVSSFALPGSRAIHNQLYWDHRNYLGFGPSAFSFWWKGLPALRWDNIRNVRRYQGLLEGRHRPVSTSEELDLDTLANEYIMLRLRTSEGLDLDHLEDQYGIDLYDERVEDLAWLESEGLIHPIRRDLVRLTDEGMIFADMVTTKLMLG